MKKITELLKNYPIIFDLSHSIGAIILTLDLFKIINSFQASQFLDWNIYEQIAFRTIGAFVYGIFISLVWEGEIQEKRVEMKASKRDVINMILFATLTGFFLPYLNFSLLTLIIATALLICFVVVYLKVFFNNKKE